LATSRATLFSVRPCPSNRDRCRRGRRRSRRHGTALAHCFDLALLGAFFLRRQPLANIEHDPVRFAAGVRRQRERDVIAGAHQLDAQEHRARQVAAHGDALDDAVRQLDDRVLGLGAGNLEDDAIGFGIDAALEARWRVEIDDDAGVIGSAVRAQLADPQPRGDDDSAGSVTINGTLAKRPRKSRLEKRASNTEPQSTTTVGREDVVHRIDLHAVLEHFVVHVRTAGAAARADAGDDLTAFDALAALHQGAAAVRVARHQTVAVVDFDQQAVAAGARRLDDDTVGGGANRRSRPGGEIDTTMHRVWPVNGSMRRP
jgi:hypothetical protein